MSPPAGSLEVGTDIIEVERIAAAVARWKGFLPRVFTSAELTRCLGRADASQELAGRFAAKEAVIKCLGRAVPWRCIEILNERSGKPYVVLHGRARELAGGASIAVSISHSRCYATAVAILVRP